MKQIFSCIVFVATKVIRSFENLLFIFFRTIFAKLPRHTYIDPDYSFTDYQMDAIHRHKEYYANFIHELQRNRRSKITAWFVEIFNSRRHSAINRFMPMRSQAERSRLMGKSCIVILTTCEHLKAACFIA